jgi:hypothetical protein
VVDLDELFCGLHGSSIAGGIRRAHHGSDYHVKLRGSEMFVVGTRVLDFVLIDLIDQNSPDCGLHKGAHVWASTNSYG